MSIIFDVNSMKHDLRAFAKAASSFVEGADQRFRQLEASLENSVRNASAEKASFVWRTRTAYGDGPIRTKRSTTYRNAGTEAKPLFGEILFDLIGRMINADDTRVEITSGSTSMSLFRHDDSEPLKVIHFDIHGLTAGSAEGHPLLHVQVLGKINDIPRIPIPFVHPLDVLEFALMELFQSRWRSYRVGVAAKSALGRFPGGQAFRLSEAMKWMLDRMGDISPRAPLLALQLRPRIAFQFHGSLPLTDPSG
jgi:hypothetical protein